MIEKTDAIELLEKNLQRTEMLIEAMEKIKAYNGLYQMSNADACEHNKIVTIVQNQQLMYIQQSCGEHAIISLATAFEIYYKELVQQLFADYPGYFVSRNTKYSDKLNKLIQDHELATYEQIEFELKLRNRFDYYILFKAYSLPFLTLAEKRVVEYIYQQRNLYVHNAGRLYSKSRKNMILTRSPFYRQTISQEAKRLRTRLRKLLHTSYDRIKVGLNRGV